jgi:two-component system LytT family response regulator
MTPIRVAIVDDEPLAREALREMLAVQEDVEIVGEYRNGAAFLAKLPELQPDVVFLDVEMPRVSGFDVARALRETPEPAPFVVFVTAFERHAVRAFDEQATDYLLKPLECDRLSRTVTRVRQQMQPAQPPALPLESLVGVTAEPDWLTRLAIKAPGRAQLLHVDDVDWFQTAGNYVRVHVGAASHLFRASMASIESRLDPRRFVRIHRATIVNVDRIVELQTSFAREHVVLLRSGARLRLSAPYRARLREMIEGL